MKKSYRLLVFWILGIALSVAKAQTGPEILQNIHSFRFNEAAVQLKSYQGPHKSLYQGIVENAFNQNRKSNASLRLEAFESLPDSLKFEYLRTLQDNAIKLQDYALAYSTGKLVLDQYARFYTEKEREGETDALKIWKCLQNSPTQSVKKSANTQLSFERDMAGLHTLPIDIGKAKHQFVFDTGAGISCLTASYARQLGIKIISKEPINVEGATGADNNVQIGIVPRLSFGNIAVKNAVFMVFPDSAFSFAGGAYKINGIVGFPIIAALGQITMREDSISIPKSVPVRELETHNFAFVQNSPIIYLRVFETELPCLFDTGDGDFSFSKPFYDQFSAQLKGEFKQLSSEGAGGAQSYKGFVAEPFHIFAGGQDIVPKTIVVNTEYDHILESNIYGNIGQGIIKLFKRTRIDFVNSEIHFE